MSLILKKSALPLVLTLVFMSGCNESTSSSHGDGYDTGNPPIDTGFNEQALVTNIADNIISPVFDAFDDVAHQNHQLVTSYCAAVKADSVDDTLVNAQVGWRNTMTVWQQAEMMQVEPLIANESELRGNIYSWPAVYTCGVDFDTMYFLSGEFNGQPYDIEKRLANRKGLYALEYLLFNPNVEHSCGTETPPGWNDLSSQEIIEARCEFATEVARDLTVNAETLVNRWNTFADDLKSAGQAESSFESLHAAVNHLSDAMFYLDSIAKDAKLATPLGLFTNSCGSQACPEDVESNFAYHSVENLIENLNGFNQFFTGGNTEQSVGFVDYLNFVGDTDTAETMTVAITTAIDQLEAYQETLAEALMNNEAQVEATHANVKAITDELKTDFITSLALELPKTSAGDND